MADPGRSDDRVVSESDAIVKQPLSLADRAMFEAKRAGGDRRQIYGQ